MVAVMFVNFTYNSTLDVKHTVRQQHTFVTAFIVEWVIPIKDVHKKITSNLIVSKDQCIFPTFSG